MNGKILILVIGLILFASCVGKIPQFTEQETDYDHIQSLTDVNGKLAYEAKQGDRWFIVYGEDEVGKEYDQVWAPREVNGKLTYQQCKEQSNN